MTDVVTCGACGAQYISSATVCADCGAPLGGDRLEPTDDEVGYDLDDWAPEQRAQLTATLVAEGVAHRWEGTELVVREVDAEGVEAHVDALDHPDALAVDDDDSDAGAELLSALYVASDVLKSDPTSTVAIIEVLEAADLAVDLGPPYGIDPQLWREVQDRAGDVAELLAAEAGNDEVAAAAAALRDAVRPLV